MVVFRRHALSLGVALVLAAVAGCANGHSAPPTQAAAQATASRGVLLMQVQPGERQVQGFGGIPALPQLVNNLPARIAAADAEKYLVYIDAGKIRPATTYNVLDVDPKTSGTSGRSGGWSGSNTWGRSDNWGYDWDNLGYSLYGGWGTWGGWGPANDFWQLNAAGWYYPYGGSLYYPYSLYGGYYYPFLGPDPVITGLSDYPFLYGAAGGIFNPYYYAAPSGLRGLNYPGLGMPASPMPSARPY